MLFVLARPVFGTPLVVDNRAIRKFIPLRMAFQVDHQTAPPSTSFTRANGQAACGTTKLQIVQCIIIYVDSLRVS